MLLKDLKENKEIAMMRKAYISFPSIHDHETHPDVSNPAIESLTHFIRFTTYHTNT